MYLSWFIMGLLAIGLYSWGRANGRREGFNDCQSSHAENTFDPYEDLEDDY